jgi:hypothetical protein
MSIEKDVPDESTEPRIRRDFERARPEMHALKARELIPVNLDPISAATTALAVAQRVFPFREQILVTLRDFPIEHLDKLEIYASATLQAQANYTFALRKDKSAEKLLKDATELRETFLTDVTALARRKFVSQTVLKKVRGGHGHTNLVQSLLALTTLFRNHWEEISSSTAISLEELDRAEALGLGIISKLSHHNKKPEETKELALERQQAYTLLIRAYNDVRHAIQYLRRYSNDADNLVPSLYGGRKVPKRIPRDIGTSPTQKPDNVANEPDLRNDDPFLNSTKSLH